MCEPMPSNTQTVFLALSFANADFKFLEVVKQDVRDFFHLK